MQVAGLHLTPYDVQILRHATRPRLSDSRVVLRQNIAQHGMELACIDEGSILAGVGKARRL